MIKKWDERIVPAAPPCVEEEEIHMAMLAEIDELRAKLAAAETSANELRRAVAELIGADPETWPNHGNAPLAIAACVAVRQVELAALEAKLAALEVLYLNSLADATQWQLYKSRKDAVIAAGMGKKAMRDLSTADAPTCTSDEWLANCPQSVRDLADKIKAGAAPKEQL